MTLMHRSGFHCSLVCFLPLCVSEQSPYNHGQNAGSAPLVYSPQTQPMNAQPQSRPVSFPLPQRFRRTCIQVTLGLRRKGSCSVAHHPRGTNVQERFSYFLSRSWSVVVFAANLTPHPRPPILLDYLVFSVVVY